ncbi:MAG TPA: hypothetical protein VLQ89_04400 [Candidatus Binatia bacterium]|nr:hypothetical protein [Candidatus Binatia bacterium]
MERYEAHRPNANQGNQRFWKHPDLPFSRLPMVCLSAIIDPNSTPMRSYNSLSIFPAIVVLEADERQGTAAHFFQQTGSRGGGGEKAWPIGSNNFCWREYTEKQDKS